MYVNRTLHTHASTDPTFPLQRLKTLPPLSFPLCIFPHLSMAAVTRLFRSTTSSTTTTFFRRTITTIITPLNSESQCPLRQDTNITKEKNKKKKNNNNSNNIQWVFLGCPGVGKGTYASRLSKLLGVPHIATGDLVREALSSSGPLASQLKEIVNQGKLVSDEIIINLLSKRLEAGESKEESGFILDGFPRTIRQAEILEGVTEIDLVVNLQIREDVLLAKCLGRRTCSECGGNFNVACIDIKGENGDPGMYMAPLLPPSHCTSKLITRADDTELVVKERLRIYNEMSQPVEEFYRSRGKLMEFELPGGIPASWPKLLEALNLSEHEDKRLATA